MDILRQTSIRRRFVLDALTFKLFRYGRNIIYRIKGKFSWYIKITRHINNEVIQREMFGAYIIREVLNNHSCYWYPSVRASVENSYVIYSEIPGNTLHMNFYRGCLTPFKKYDNVRNVFFCFGEILGHLHSKDIKIDVPPQNRNAYTILLKKISMISKPDYVIEKIIQKIEYKQPIKSELKFTHGNLRLDNVLMIKNKICIIDFENCGRGSPYEDISNVCCRIILMSLVPMFPIKRALNMLDSFLDGYRVVEHIDIETLLEWTAVRVAIYYAENHDKIPIIAKIPASKERLRRFVLCLLDGSIESVLPGYTVSS